MKELGYADGQTYVAEVHLANGDNKRLGQLAADLVQRNVDIIFPVNTQATVAARYATANEFRVLPRPRSPPHSRHC